MPPSKSSVYADEGTKAHAIAEAILLHKGNVSSIPPDIAVYTDYVQSLGGILQVEKRVKVSESVPGTADAVVWDPHTATLEVIDLKYGQGVSVEVMDNLQLRIYALAALLTLNYPAVYVKVTIVQPRYNHADGPIRSVKFWSIDLLEFHADLLDAEAVVEEAEENHRLGLSMSEYLVPSEEGCRWCNAAPTCPAVYRRAKELAKEAFLASLPYDPAKLSEALKFIPILEGWIKNVREFSAREVESGAKIPGWKLVAKRPTRKWIDVDAAAAALAAVGLDEEDYMVRQLVSPAAAERLLGKGNKDLMEGLTTKESSGNTLVPDDDKRSEAVMPGRSIFWWVPDDYKRSEVTKQTAKDAFENLT